MGIKTLRQQTKLIASTLITALGLTAAGFPFAQTESWELRTAAQEVQGTRALEAGKLDKAIRIMDAYYNATPFAEKGAILTNLCLIYILKREFAVARGYCDLAVDRGFNDHEAYNNRGVLRSLEGDFQGAVSDFEKAGCLGSCPEDLNSRSTERMEVARRNLQRAVAQYTQQHPHLQVEGSGPRE